MPFHKLLPLYLFLLALLVRMAFLFGTYSNNAQVPYFEDVGIAINLLEGSGYAYNFTMIAPNVPTRPTAAKPPMYPLLVSLVFHLFGMKNFFALFTVHAVLSALTCSFLFLSIARFSHNIAAIAGLSCAVYLPFIHHAVSVPESTTLMMFLLSVFCFLQVSLHKHFSQGKLVISAAASGFLALTEPVTVPFIFLVFLYILYITFSSWQKISKEMLITTLIFTAIIAPWTLRNYIVFDKFVFIKSNFGSFLKDSLYHSGIRLPQAEHSALRRQVEGLDEISEDRAVKKAMVAWIVANPMTYLRLLPRNFVNFWWETEKYQQNYTIKYIFGRKIPYTFLLIFSVPAMVWKLIQFVMNANSSINTNVYHNMMFILIFIYSVVYTIGGAFLLRYHFPVELAMLIFFAETLLYVSKKLRDGLMSGVSSARGRSVRLVAGPPENLS